MCYHIIINTSFLISRTRRIIPAWWHISVVITAICASASAPARASAPAPASTPQRQSLPYRATASTPWPMIWWRLLPDGTATWAPRGTIIRRRSFSHRWPWEWPFTTIPSASRWNWPVHNTEKTRIRQIITRKDNGSKLDGGQMSIKDMVLFVKQFAEETICRIK